MMKHLLFTVATLVPLWADAALAETPQAAQESGNVQDAEQPRIQPPDKSWVVYYGSELPSSAFEDYDIIVFDRDKHPPIQNLKSRGKILLGYISAGEAEKYRSDYDKVKATQALLAPTPEWPDHVAVDVRNPAWTRYLIEDVIPGIIRQGFHGIFIDTLDRPEELEARDPEKYRGMTLAAAEMVRTIHRHYPDLRIMVNRGFNVMPHIAEDVDYLLAEGVMVKYDMKDGRHELFPDSIYQEYVDKIASLKKGSPHLQIVTLDYWDVKDKEMVKEIYRRQKANGFMPYVTSIALDKVDKAPQ